MPVGIPRRLPENSGHDVIRAKNQNQNNNLHGAVHGLADCGNGVGSLAEIVDRVLILNNQISALKEKNLQDFFDR